MGGAVQRPAAAPSLLLLAVLFVGRAAAFGGGATALHGHAAFFDRDGDGVVTLSETYGAFRALGFGFGLSSVSAAFINGALGGSYDAEGRFVPEKFEQIFAKHAKTVPDALTSDEVDQLLQANRQPGHYSGWAGAEAEWKILYNLGKDKDGLLHKDVVRSVYDGSLFHRLAPNWNSPEKEKLSREN